MDNQLAFVLCVMAQSITLDREKNRAIAGYVVGQATRIKFPDPSDEETIEDYAVQYVQYQYHDNDKPDWLVE